MHPNASCLDIPVDFAEVVLNSSCVLLAQPGDGIAQPTGQSFWRYSVVICGLHFWSSVLSVSKRHFIYVASGDGFKSGNPFFGIWDCSRKLMVVQTAVHWIITRNTAILMSQEAGLPKFLRCKLASSPPSSCCWSNLIFSAAEMIMWTNLATRQPKVYSIFCTGFLHTIFERLLHIESQRGGHFIRSWLYSFFT